MSKPKSAGEILYILMVQACEEYNLAQLSWNEQPPRVREIWENFGLKVLEMQRKAYDTLVNEKCQKN